MISLQEPVREDAQPSTEPVILSEEKKCEASERETTRSETHGHLDTKIVENVSEQKDHVSRTELLEGGIRVVKEESVEAVKVVRETSVSEKQICTSDGEFKPVFSDEPFQVLMQTRLSMGEPVFMQEESYNEAAVDVNGIENCSKPDVVPDNDTEKPVKVEVLETSPKQQEENIDYEVKASESDGMPENEDDVQENHQQEEIKVNEQDEAKDKSIRDKSKSPKGGLFSFFKKKSDSEAAPEDQKKSEKERKKEEKERKEREKKEEKQRKQKEKEEKERKKREEKEKKKGKNKGNKEDQRTQDDNPALANPESPDLNKSFQSAVTSTESEEQSVQEESISPSFVERVQQEIPVELLDTLATESAPIVENELKDTDDDQKLNGEDNIIYPIETDVVVKEDRRTHTLSVSSDHREEIIQVW